MLWFKRTSSAAATGAAEFDLVEPAELPVSFSPELFQRHLSVLLEAAKADGGAEAYLKSLNAKHDLFAIALDAEPAGHLDLEKLELLLETVFTARRKLFPVFRRLGATHVVAQVEQLLHGNGPVDGRMRSFAAAIAGVEGEGREARSLAARVRGAARDLAAELLHFRDPVKYPLMARWVWDEATMSGALREFIPGAESMNKLPLDSRPETFEGVRKWFSTQIEAQGIYRDVPFWIDLVQVSGYSHYFRAMTGGMMGPEFNRSCGPEDEMKRLLGIDLASRGGQLPARQGDH